MAYVSVSRGQWDAQVFTNDRTALANALSHDVSHESAYQPQQAIAPSFVRDVAQAQEHEFGPSMGIGLGSGIDGVQKKPPARIRLAPSSKILVSREEPLGFSQLASAGSTTY